MKILCATDLGRAARNAAQWAVVLAKRTGGTVELLHVVPPPMVDLSPIAPGVRLGELTTPENAKAGLELERVLLSAASSETPVTAEVREGDVVTSVVERAKTIDADLIVLAAHHLSTLHRLVLGSTCDRTLRRADCPVLVVPPDTGASKARAEATTPLVMTVALDGTPRSGGALEFARSLRAKTSCDVEFLRTYWPPAEYERLGITGAHDLSRPDPNVVDALSRSLAQEVGALPGRGAVSFSVEPCWGDPSQEILDRATLRGCELLVMGSESRHGLARIAHSQVANRVAHHLVGIPVVFAPPVALPERAAGLPRLFTVLAATDLSSSSKETIRRAYALLADHGGVVELCHVHERGLAPPAYAYDHSEGRLVEGERRRLMAELRQSVPAEASQLGITTHFNLIDGGRAAHAICQAAERWAVDAIVVGGRSRDGSSSALGRSVADEVAHEARQPVMVVPKPKVS